MIIHHSLRLFAPSEIRLCFISQIVLSDLEIHSYRHCCWKSCLLFSTSRYFAGQGMRGWAFLLFPVTLILSRNPELPATFYGNSYSFTSHLHYSIHLLLSQLYTDPSITPLGATIRPLSHVSCSTLKKEHADYH